MAFCSKCGYQLKGNEKFCPKCGQAVQGIAKETTSKTTPTSSSSASKVQKERVVKPESSLMSSQPNQSQGMPTDVTQTRTSTERPHPSQEQRPWLKKTWPILLGIFVIFLGVNYWYKNRPLDVMPYAIAKFHGMSGHGEAIGDVDYELLREKYNQQFKPNPNRYEENFDYAIREFELKFDKDQDLKNGDTVKLIIEIPKESQKRLKGGEKTFKVEGLEEPKVLKTDLIQKHLIVNFVGISGKGSVKVDSTLPGEFQYLTFNFDNDGQLKNGDKVVARLSPESEQSLLNQGYVLEEGFAPTFEVKGLDQVANQASEIANLEDIKRMINEEVKRRYEDQFYPYEVTLEHYMYNPFPTDEQGNLIQNGAGHFIGIFRVKQLSRDDESKLQEESTSIIGFTNLITDENKQVNVALMEPTFAQKDDSYSSESILQLFEGLNYQIVD
ncbi:zinc ribbon domain-containing protein [Vaginisenegalia massiliensis]|uniref:zinc ribbon domain-containing protein n=1 Tax=Vaginisenegalia massiliensis TaxID=2058294 RepID=UPI000F540043|nr:zinc ribbon domain-containing protein [Vaginisenegalia massiliensis]